MTRIKLSLIVSLVSCAGSPAVVPAEPAPAGATRSEPQGLPFDVAQLRADIGFLASDPLEGRRTGTRGYDIAVEYAAARFAMLGLAPAGEHGYIQPVRLREVTPDLTA